MNWQPKTVRDFVARHASAQPDAEALVTDKVRLTYRELYDEAWRAAKAMHALGVRRGDFIGLLLPNDDKWVVLLCGAAFLGAVTVPANTRFKAAELAFCLKQADAKALFLTDRFLKIDFVSFLRDAEPAVDERLPGKALPLLQNVVVVGTDVPRGALDWMRFLALGATVSDADLEAAVAATKPDDLLLIQFTSGTTAFPKGVMLSHDNMLHDAWAAGTRMGVRADDRYFNCRPFFHVAGSTLSLLVSLVFGACMVTLPTFEARGALKMMERERCTLTSGNDTIFQMMMSDAEFDPQKLCLRGGWAAAGPETMRKIIDVMGAGFCWAYGLSEASPNVVINDHRDPADIRIAGLAKPHDGVNVRIADPETNAPLAVGTAGEIQVRGWNVMRGYYKNPEANAKVFTPDGWLRTGDLGTLTPDGRLSLVGRLKDVFRVGGENVAPAEVEEVLLAHPAIATAQVIGVPDARLGEVPAAFVTLKAGASATEAELLDYMKARCANFRVPRYMRIVPDFEAIGMTASGKVQKRKLREHALKEFGLADQ